MMNEDQFIIIADKKLLEIANSLEELNPDLEIDLLGEVLNIYTSSGQYVINRHTASRQIWLASPLSGPKHFSYKDGNWETSSNIDLDTLLKEEFSSKV